MIVYAASDLHGNLPPVPEDAELVLLAGDICPDFREPGRHRHWGYGVDRDGLQQETWLRGPFRKWTQTFDAPVVATWGNHDFVAEAPGRVPDIPYVTWLTDEEAYVKGLRIYGTPWVPGLPYWAFYGDERRLSLRAEAIPEHLDVLMTHGPPLMLGDYIPTSEKQRNKYGNYGGQHVGDPTLNEALDLARPKLVLCGHIHEARGAYLSEKNVPVYNVAAVDALYDLHDPAFTRFVCHEQ